MEQQIREIISKKGNSAEGQLDLSLPFNITDCEDEPPCYITDYEEEFESKAPKYDVFLSFRGQDNRNNFTSHLYAMLKSLRQEFQELGKRRKFQILFDGRPVHNQLSGYEKRYKFKREYYKMARFVRMLSEKFDDKLSFQEHANPIEYQTSHADGVRIHNQRYDPDGEPLISTPPNRTGNAPATFFIEAGVAVSTAISSSPPGQTVNSAGESSDTECGTSSFPAASQTPPDDGDAKKETPSENDNNNGVNKTPLDDDDAKKETPSKNDNNNNGVNKTPPDGDDAKKETPSKVSKITPKDDHKGKCKLENALMVGGQIISTFAAISAKNAKSEMSNEAEFLLYVLAACLSFSLISICCGFCLSALQLSKSAQVVRKVGMVITGFAFVVATGLQFPNELMLWFTLGVLAVSAPAIIGFAWKYQSS